MRAEAMEMKLIITLGKAVFILAFGWFAFLVLASAI